MFQLTPAQIQYEVQHEGDNAAPRMLASYIICMILAYVAVALRFYSRCLSSSKIYDTDYMIIVALVRDPLLQRLFKSLGC